MSGFLSLFSINAFAPPENEAYQEEQ